MEKLVSIAAALKRDLELTDITPSTLYREAEAILSVAEKGGEADITWHVAKVQIRLRHSANDLAACRKVARTIREIVRPKP